MGLLNKKTAADPSHELRCQLKSLKQQLQASDAELAEARSLVKRQQTAINDLTKALRKHKHRNAQLERQAAQAADLQTALQQTESSNQQAAEYVAELVAQNQQLKTKLARPNVRPIRSGVTDAQED